MLASPIHIMRSPHHEMDGQPVTSFKVESTGFPSPLDALSTQQPVFAFPSADESSCSPSDARLLMSPILHSSVYASALMGRSTSHTLPPSMSLFPSMSAADDAAATAFDKALLKLQQLDGPIASSRETSTSMDVQWPGDDPLSSSSTSAMPSHSSSSSSSNSSGESQLASPLPQPKPSREQRKLSKRLKQRRADLHRRKRETAALSEMKQLIAAAKQVTNSHTGNNTAGEETETQHRVQILESSAARMRELQLLVNLLSQTCDAQQQEIHALSEQVERSDIKSEDWSRGSAPSFSVFEQVTGLNMSSGAAPSKRMRLLASTMSSTLNATLGHQSLQQARFSPVVFAAVLTDCATGLVLDVNEGMIVQGWQRNQLVGHTAMEGYDAVMDARGWQMGENADQRVLVPSTVDGHLKPAGRSVQYERSKRLLRELYAGKIGVCVALWRGELADGRIHEVEASTWIDGWEGAVDASGRVSRRPLRAVSVTSLGDARLLE